MNYNNLSSLFITSSGIIIPTEDLKEKPKVDYHSDFRSDQIPELRVHYSVKTQLLIK